MDRFEHRYTLRRPAARPRAHGLIVLKFGGTSVGSGEQLRKVRGIIERAAASSRIVVVASAAAAVTDWLVEAARNPTSSRREVVERLRRHHLQLAEEVLHAMALEDYRRTLDGRLDELDRWLKRIHRKGLTGAAYDAVISEGERLSVPLISLMICQAGISSVAVDSSLLIRTDANHGEARVDFDATTYFVQQWIQTIPDEMVPVVTGFVGSTDSGAITTLGRSGSDYSASILAACLDARRLERWTDVDGLYSDDPRTNADAQRLSCIVLETAQAWNSAGRLGMHRKALEPLVEARIPVHIRCTNQPDLPGTIIIPDGEAHEARTAV